MRISLAAVFSGLGHEKFGVSEGVRAGAAQAAALFMIALTVLIIGLVVAFAVTMARRSRKPDQTLKFLEDLDVDERNPVPPAASRTAQPWERTADWWRK
ncbi:MAG: hypothetical protein ACR2OZ_20965 [Verrucomicrobiales bacterium]